MEYVSKSITNFDSGKNQVGNEAVFIHNILLAFKEAFGNRIVITEENDNYTTNYENITTGNANYYATFNIDNKITIKMIPRVSSGASRISMFHFLISTLGESSVSSSTYGINFTTNYSLLFSDITNRNINLKIFEEKNILFIQILSSSSITTSSNKKSLILCVLKDNDENIFALSSIRLNSDPQFSDFFLDSNNYMNLQTGELFTLPSLLKYSYEQGSTTLDIIPNKKAFLGNSANIYTNFTNLLDCSNIAANQFFTLNEQQYCSLNNYTLLKINNGFNKVQTLTETSQQPTPEEP